jgi:hypothetical protein
MGSLSLSYCRAEPKRSAAVLPIEAMVTEMKAAAVYQSPAC